MWGIERSNACYPANIGWYNENSTERFQSLQCHIPSILYQFPIHFKEGHHFYSMLGHYACSCISMSGYRAVSWPSELDWFRTVVMLFFESFLYCQVSFEYLFWHKLCVEDFRTFELTITLPREAREWMIMIGLMWCDRYILLFLVFLIYTVSGQSTKGIYIIQLT